MIFRRIVGGLLHAFAKFSIFCVDVWFHAVHRPVALCVDPSVQTNRLGEPRIIVANHTSLCDPPFLTSVLRGPKAMIVAKDWFERPSIRWIASAAGGIPCDRFNLDTEWILHAKRALKEGRSVVIFPEGKIREDGGTNEFKSGFAFLARTTGVPVVAVALEGNYRFGHRIRYVVDTPRLVTRTKGVPSGADLERQSEQFRERVMELKKRAAAGRLCGDERVDVLPEPAAGPDKNEEKAEI